MKDLKAQVTDEYLQEIERKIKLYQELDCKFKNDWADFEERYQKEVAHLDELRERRNAQLDDVKRSIRTYSETSDDKSMEIGEFKAVKKWSKFYNKEKLLEMLEKHGLMAAALGEGIVMKSLEIAKYDKIRAFLERWGYAEGFECCEDAQEAGVAIFGPKAVPMLGAELPKE
jgi:hypothetical protein